MTLNLQNGIFIIVIYVLVIKDVESSVENNITSLSTDDLPKLIKQKDTLSAKQINGTTNFTGSTQITRPCSCGNGLCSCCSRLLFNSWKQKACVNVTYDPDEFSFTAKVLMNDRILYTRTVSGKNPKPVCVPMPRLPAMRACVRFYNIYFQGRNVHACMNMEGKFRDTTVFKVGFDCIRLGANGVAVVKPEDGGGLGQIEFLPATDDNDDDYDEDEDADTDDLDDFGDDDDEDDDDDDDGY